ADRPRRLKPGTVLLREYQGERHPVTVVPNGYVLARDDLCQPLDHRPGHHRHELERTALLWAKKRRGAKGFVGSGQCVAGTKEPAMSCSGTQVASGWRRTKTSRR